MTNGLATPPVREKEPCQLEDVIGEHGGGPALGQLHADRKAVAQRKIERCGGGGEAETGQNRKPQAEPENADQDRARLSRDRKPAQPDERIEPQAARLTAKSFWFRRKHVGAAFAFCGRSRLIRSSRWDRRPRASPAGYSP